jgi:hypothetical protein
VLLVVRSESFDYQFGDQAMGHSSDANLLSGTELAVDQVEQSARDGHGAMARRLGRRNSSMNDDWRLQVDLHEESHGRALSERLDAQQLQHDLSDAFHDRVIVTRDGAQVFLYAGTREQAEKAREAIESDARQHGWSLEVDFRHWHPLAEEWEDPDKPLPASDAAKLAERKELMARERKETEKRGYPEFEVRADLPSHHDALVLSEQLRAEGIPVVHRWRYLLVGATDEDSTKALAERIKNEAPAGSRVEVEGTWAAVYGERPRNPFAVLGGLGG